MLRELESSITAHTDFVPVAALRRSLDGLAKEFGFKIADDNDDLGPVRCAYLETGDGNRFLLRRYSSYPAEIVDLFIPSRLPNHAQAVDDIIGELNVGRDDMIAGEGSYDRLR
jgi:hypothetical protein